MIANSLRNILVVGLVFVGMTAFGETPAPSVTTEIPENQPVLGSVGKVKVGTLLQFWGISDTVSSSIGNQNFRLKRGEFKLSGSVLENTRWFIMSDFAKSLTVPVSATNDNKVLQDLGIGHTFCTNFEFLVGQVKFLADFETHESSGELWFPERSLVTRSFGDKRQPGAMLTYKDKTLKASVMASNGQKANNDDTNSEKDISARAEVKPMDELTVGLFTLASDGRTKVGHNGADLKFSFEQATLRGLYIAGDNEGTKSTGIVGDLGYKVTDKIEPVFRYETYRPNMDAGNDSNSYTLGLNYYCQKQNAKVQLAGTAYHNMTGGNGSTAFSTTSKDGTLVTLAFQMML